MSVFSFVNFLSLNSLCSLRDGVSGLRSPGSHAGEVACFWVSHLGNPIPPHFLFPVLLPDPPFNTLRCQHLLFFSAFGLPRWRQWSRTHLPMQQTETQDRSLGGEDTLEKEMVTHSSILAWRIPWTEEPGELRFIALHRVGHD